jgi:hypothetical protein
MIHEMNMKMLNAKKLYLTKQPIIPIHIRVDIRMTSFS